MASFIEQITPALVVLRDPPTPVAQPDLARNREQWLEHAVRVLGEVVFAQACIELPPVKVSCSWPGGGSARRRIGECWSRAASTAGINEVFISPALEDPLRVLDVLCHELVHAVDDCKNAHKAPFVRMAKAVGLETAKPSSTTASAALRQVLVDDVLPVLGTYPHARLSLAAMRKKDPRSAFIKFSCTACDMAFRVTAGHAENVHCCPCCGDEDNLIAE